jgi:hypothetical protein
VVDGAATRGEQLPSAPLTLLLKTRQTPGQKYPDLGLRVEAMGLEPTNLLTARLEPSALTAGHRPPNGQVSSAFASLPLNGERSVLVGEERHALVPALVPSSWTVEARLVDL